MNPSDLIIICAQDLPFRQAADLVRWYIHSSWVALVHPSTKWWIENNLEEFRELVAEALEAKRLKR